MNQKVSHDQIGMYFTRSNHLVDGYDVVQRSSGVVVAQTSTRRTAQEAAASINACAIIPRLSPPLQYRPFVKDPEELKPQGLFLVRVIGKHPATGTKYPPKVVAMEEGKLYSLDNDVEPIIWSRNGNFKEGPTDDPYQANLEWMPLPDNS